MASVENKAMNQLNSLSECCICLVSYKDPRMLPCIHSACLKCFEDLQAKNNKEPGDVLPCPICRNEFKIPADGMKGLQKNFFIENLIEVTQALNTEIKSVPCSLCKIIDEEKDANEATMICLECRENFCSRCCKVHKSSKSAQHHAIVDLNSQVKDEEIRAMFTLRNCPKHTHKPLELYCEECKLVVCVSCFVEDHKLHNCKDVTTVDKDLRRKLESSTKKMLGCIEQMEAMRSKMEKKKENLLEQTSEIENAIRLKNQQLMALVDQHTKVAFNELFSTKQKLLKSIETEIDEIERKVTILRSFEVYCLEINSKGSPTEVCGCVDSLIRRGDELEREQYEYLSCPENVAEVKFIAIDQDVLIENISNFIGKIEERAKSYAIVIGGSDATTLFEDVTKINLYRSDDVSSLQKMPTNTQMEFASSVYGNSIYITGIGDNADEIWNFDALSNIWKKCASMVKGRRRHSVAFVDHFLYICGGYYMHGIFRKLLNNVEVYDAINDRSSSVGELVHCVQNSGNCVPFNSSLYIFGGVNNGNEKMSHVQVYDTKSNTCTLLSHSIPSTIDQMRAALFEKTVILLGRDNCFLYDLDRGAWQQRPRFKTGVIDFGLVIEKGQIFVFGGKVRTRSVDGYVKWNCGNDVKCIPVKDIIGNRAIEWRHHARLPRRASVYACEKIEF